MLLLTIAVFFLSLSNLSGGSVTDLSRDENPFEFYATSNVPVHFCHEQNISKDYKLHEMIFHDRVFEVTTNGSDFAWHSIRGVSKDDAHSHVQSLIYRALDADDSMKSKLQPHEVKSIIRDLVSSCPSPFLASNRKRCAMRFSVFSKACVTINLPESTKISISLSESFNNRYVYNLITGLALIIFSGDLAKSKLFQYSSGASLFMLFGVVLVLAIFFQKLTNSKSVRTNTMFLGSLLTGYGASLVYYVRSNAKQLFLEHWEMCLGYAILSCVIGLFATSFARHNETLKHSMIVVVKWLLRFVGVTFVYNSFASPFISLISIVILLVMYVVYGVTKAVKRFFYPKKPIKQE